MKILLYKSFQLITVSMLLIGIFAVSSILLSRYMVLETASGKTYSDVMKLPENKVGLVLGCSSNNLFFLYRIRAAYEVFSSGKVKYLIVSGDNHVEGYDEPSDMKAALVKMGIPENRIYCDYAGFRTLDSVVRAKEVFNEKKITVISQKFHNQRAIFIGENRGLNIIGYNAKDVGHRSGFNTMCREHFARVKAVIDVLLTQKKPKFLGPPVYVGSLNSALNNSSYE